MNREWGPWRGLLPGRAPRALTLNVDMPVGPGVFGRKVSESSPLRRVIRWSGQLAERFGMCVEGSPAPRPPRGKARPGPSGPRCLPKTVSGRLRHAASRDCSTACLATNILRASPSDIGSVSKHGGGVGDATPIPLQVESHRRVPRLHQVKEQLQRARSPRTPWALWSILWATISLDS